MNRVQHPSNNGVLGAPPGWDQSGPTPCGALPITRVQYEGGQLAILSFWRPSAAELAALNRGACVVLSVMGAAMPPVALDVTVE